jgi:hypothetical protein
MLRPLGVDRAAMIDAEGAGFARANLVSTHLDLQPAVATSGARTTASSLTLLLHWLAHVGSGLADFSSVRLEPEALYARYNRPRKPPCISAGKSPGTSKMSVLLPLYILKILQKLN